MKVEGRKKREGDRDSGEEKKSICPPVGLCLLLVAPVGMLHCLGKNKNNTHPHITNTVVILGFSL